MGSPGVLLSALSSPRGAGARTAGLGGGTALEWDEPVPTSELGDHAQGSEPQSLGFLICETRRRLTASLTGVGTLQPDNVRMVSAKGQRRVTAKSHDCDLDREQQSGHQTLSSSGALVPACASSGAPWVSGEPALSATGEALLCRKPFLRQSGDPWSALWM